MNTETKKFAIVYCPVAGWHSQYSGPANCLADDPRVLQWGGASHDSFICNEKDAPAFVAMYGERNINLGLSLSEAISRGYKFYEGGL
jgi:hypothetical protein